MWEATPRKPTFFIQTNVMMNHLRWPKWLLLSLSQTSPPWLNEIPSTTQIHQEPSLSCCLASLLLLELQVGSLLCERGVRREELDSLAQTFTPKSNTVQGFSWTHQLLLSRPAPCIESSPGQLNVPKLLACNRLIFQLLLVLTGYNLN